MPTQFTPTRRVRFIGPDGGWRGGEVIATHQGEDWYEYRVRCPLTGKYFDVDVADCEDDGPRDDKGERT